MSGDMFFGLNLPKLNKVNVPNSPVVPPVVPQGTHSYSAGQQGGDTFERTNLLFSGVSPIVTSAASNVHRLSLNESRGHFKGPNTFSVLSEAPDVFPPIPGYED